MRGEAAIHRGKPLVALAGVMACWVGVRILLFQHDGFFAQPAPSTEGGETGFDRLLPGPTAGSDDGWEGQDVHMRELPSPAFSPPPAAPPIARPSHILVPDLSADSAEDAVAAAESVAARVAAGHQMLWMAALSRLPLSMILPRPRTSKIAPFYPAGREPASFEKRWSANGWVMLRKGGSASLATGAAPSTYGASQAGAVLRFKLSPSSPHRPAAYARVTSALNGIDEREAAVGVSVRPVPSVPVVAAVELRASDQASRTELRPAAMVVTELQPIDLPLGTRAEFYGQAGYVGGSFKTAFADGQLRIDAKVADLGPAEVRAGAGTWAGAQKGASRIDVGPTATVGMPLGEGGSARLGLDWRQRVSGQSQPGSGPAITLSAGF